MIHYHVYASDICQIIYYSCAVINKQVHIVVIADNTT